MSRRTVRRIVVPLVVIAAAPWLVVADPGSAAAAEPTSSFVPVGPTRLADTREADCGCTRIDPHTIRVRVSDRPGVPAGGVAAAVTVTALPNGWHGYVTAFPAGSSRPGTSSLNTEPRRVVANSAVIPLSADGSLDVFTLVPTDVVVDLAGIFVPGQSASAGRFQPLEPARLLDTRASSGPLPPNGEVTLPLPGGVPADATALAVNVTSVHALGPGHVSSRPAGTGPAGPSSFLNVDGSGSAVAAGAILPVSAAGMTLSSLSGGHLVVDVTGWFTGASAPTSTIGMYVPAGPTRLIDTRDTAPRIHADGTIEVASPFPEAAGLVVNVTVTQPDWSGFVTAFPAGTGRPFTSAVNPAFRDHTVANQTLVPVSTRGVGFYSTGGTDLVVDVTGWFTGAPQPATIEPAPNTPTAPRVLLVGDSALAVLGVYTDALAPLAHLPIRLEVDACRRLVHRSCLSNTTYRVPSTALEAIAAAPGAFDIAYVDAGHNDWFDDDFAWQFDVIVNALRSKGVRVILWSTYTTERVRSSQAVAAYHWNNAMLRHLTSLPQYPDVVLADWSSYSAPHPEWFFDGTHMTHPGAYAVADYIARSTAAALRAPCPKPQWAGGPVAVRCPTDPSSAPPDPVSLYR